MIECIPEEWADAVLRVEVSRTSEGTSLAHTIRLKRGPNGVTVGSDDLFLATRSLQLLSDDAGEPWSAVVAKVECTGERWSFSAEFEYRD